MTDGVNTTEMQQYLDRVARLEEERKALGDDIKEVWAEMKGKGFDVKALRKAYSLSKLGKEELQQIGLYADALGLFE